MAPRLDFKRDTAGKGTLFQKPFFSSEKDFYIDIFATSI